MDQIMDGAFRPTQIPLFDASNVLLNPKVVYRNLSVPLMIIDPITPGDWLMDFTEQNLRLANLHQDHIYHLIYDDTNHNVLIDKPDQLLADILRFLNEI